MKSTSLWYALEVMRKKERMVAEAMVRKDFECYLPLYNSRRVWSDRIKVTSVPLFPGYLFCKLDPEARRMPILTIPGVRKFVGASGMPEPIPDVEINSIKTAIDSGCPIEPCDRLVQGDRVQVKHGAFEGVEGSFVRYRGSERLILTVSLIQCSIAVEIDRALVMPVAARKIMPHGSGVGLPAQAAV